MIAAPGALFDVSLHAVAGMTVGYGLLRICRWIRGQSPLLGAIVVAGLLLQATSGVLMFWVSYLDLPALSGLHSGDGFWEVAPDARSFSIRAANAVEGGLGSIPVAEPSPTYTQLLTVWMHLVGVSPASGLFLNVTLYALLCALIVHAWRPVSRWRRDLPCALLLAGLSFSPHLVFNGTQALKDSTFLFLAAVACLGARLVFESVLDRRGETTSFSRVSRILTGLGFLSLTLYGMADLRWYYAFMLWGSLAFTLVLFAISWGLKSLRWRLPLAVTLSILTFVPCVVGAGSYADALVDDAFARFDSVENLSSWAAGTVGLIDRYRTGFETTPGATNMTQPEPSDEVDDPPDPADAPEPPEAVPALAALAAGVFTYAPRLMVGLGTFFVPMSLLQALSVVQFPGGRGLLTLTDVDTVFLDVTMVASLALLFFYRSNVRQHLPYLCCLLLLACVSVALLSYVVINFGTLVRLRPMAVVPIWMAVLAAAPGRDRTGLPLESAPVRDVIP